MTKTTLSKRRTHNERFGATAAGSADLKGSAGMPPLRQAAIPLAASGDDDDEIPKRNVDGEPTTGWKVIVNMSKDRWRTKIWSGF